MKILKTLFKEYNLGVRFVSHSNRIFKLIYQPYKADEKDFSNRVVSAYLLSANGWVEVATDNDIEVPEINLLADHSQITIDDLKSQGATIFEQLQTHVEMLYP